MKILLLLSLLSLAQVTATAASLPYPVIIAPQPTVPNFQPSVAQAPSLTPTIRVYSAPAVQTVRPAVAVAVPVRR